MRLWILAFFPFLLSSCINPTKQTLTIGEDFIGRVIDAETRGGIPEAKIRYLLIDQYYTKSDATGVFTIEPKELEKTHGLPPAPVCPPPWSWDNNGYKIEISADGYEGGVFKRIKYRIVATSPDAFASSTSPGVLVKVQMAQSRGTLLGGLRLLKAGDASVPLDARIPLPEGFDFECTRSVEADGAIVSLCLNPDKLQFVTNELDQFPPYASLLPFGVNGDVGDDTAVPFG